MAREPHESPGLLLWRSTLAWQRRISAALVPYGLTHAQFVILASTWWLSAVSGESPSQRRIADHAGTDAMMTSQLVRKLEQRGYLRRSRDAADARAFVVMVTDEGAALAAEAVAVVERIDQEFFAGAEPAQLLPVLRHLANRG